MNQTNRNQFVRALLAEGISLHQFLVFQLILEHDSEPLPPTMGVVATYLEVSTAAATQMVERLVKQGLIKRMGHPADRRSLCISITEKGRAMLHRIHTASEQVSQSNIEPIRPYQYRSLGPVSVNEQSFAG